MALTPGALIRPFVFRVLSRGSAPIGPYTMVGWGAGPAPITRAEPLPAGPAGGPAEGRGYCASRESEPELPPVRVLAGSVGCPRAIHSRAVPGLATGPMHPQA